MEAKYRCRSTSEGADILQEGKYADGITLLELFLSDDPTNTTILFYCPCSATGMPMIFAYRPPA